MNVLEALIANDYEFYSVTVTAPFSASLTVEMLVKDTKEDKGGVRFIKAKTIIERIDKHAGTPEYLELLYEYQYLSPQLWRAKSKQMVTEKATAEVMLPEHKK